MTANPSRKVMGVIDGSDWPPKTVTLEAFYLLTLGSKPTAGKDFWSSKIPVFTHTLQWSWIIAGTDLQAGKVGRSRGDRYRTSITMREELDQAHRPWFTEKKSWAVVGSTPSGLALTGTSLTPSERIWWSELLYVNRVDKESGLIYGTATVYLTDMDTEVAI